MIGVILTRQRHKLTLDWFISYNEKGRSVLDKGAIIYRDSLRHALLSTEHA
jgi:hypothetical protein